VCWKTTISKQVCDVTLLSLEKIVSDAKLSMGYIIQLGEEGQKSKIQHLSLQNKNSLDLFLMFKDSTVH